VPAPTRCPACRAETLPGAVFCTQCGSRLQLRCGVCGAVNGAGDRFCRDCGRALEPASSPAPEGVAEAGERRQLTVMFCDLVGSTTLSARLDPEDLREVVSRYQDACARVVADHRGHVAQFLGDGVLVYFGYPQAHDDDAQRAVRAGLAIVQAVRALDPASGARLAVRVGIHTGPVVVGPVAGRWHEELAIGETPNVAARLQGEAEPDTVVISATTHRLTRGAFDCASLGARAIRGVAHPLELFRVLRAALAADEQPREDRPPLPLVGRALELGLLLERWEQARAGRGHVVLLSGEPGIGKSRLVQVVKARLAGEPHAVLESRASPHFRDSALHTASELLQRLLGLRGDDAPDDRQARLETTGRRLGGAPDTVPLLASLLGLAADAPATPPQARKQRTLEALLGLVLAAAAEEPVLLVVEDLHWVDASTLELLALLVEHAPRARLLALLTARPEFRAPWAPRSHETRLTLNRFTRRQSVALIDALTAGRALPVEVVDQIVARTDGVPLFVEELTKSVLESGVLREGEGRYELAEPLPALLIPATLQDSLTARLDRLGAAKAVAQVAAVLGRQFSYELLRAVWPGDEGVLEPGLERLVEVELLYRQGRGPQATYTFKHGLVQDAAYQSLLRSTRQRCHRRTAEVLETRFAETVATRPELLAHHLTEAGAVEPALAHWWRAGQRALERFANVEAIGHLRHALELMRALPDDDTRRSRELELQTTLGAALMAAKGYAAPEVEASYSRARELSERLGDASQLYAVLRGLWGVHVVRAELARARELGEQCLVVARRGGRPAALVWAHYMLGMTLFHLGEPDAARLRFQDGLALYDRGKRPVQRALQDPGVACLSYAAVVQWLGGAPEQARATSREALALAEALHHPFSLAYALNIAAVVSQLGDDVAETQARAAAAQALSSEHAMQYFLAWGPILQGWALAAQGRVAEGIVEARRGMAAYAATGAHLARPYFLALLADAYRHGGQIPEALDALAEALAVAERSGERWLDAELHRLSGELLLAVSPPDAEQAARRFQRALAVARGRGQTSLELRAAVSLGRLWCAQGRAGPARALVEPVYRRCTEGFETRDLREARALLETEARP
jgi:class 3 adenylate cyclase/predicted ATPase